LRFHFCRDTIGGPSKYPVANQFSANPRMSQLLLCIEHSPSLAGKNPALPA
jgi:hypothetical protein